MERAERRIEAARAAGSREELRARYRDWASDYDADVYGAAGVIGTDRIVDLLAAHVTEPGAAVLDLGCGTGAAGRRLRALGFTTVDGVDLSPEMLAVAASTGAYRGLVAADLEAPALPLADGTYGAAVSAGTFVAGHVGPAAVPAIVAALRPGAVVAWVIGDWAAFEDAVAGWRVLHRAVEPTRRGGPAESTMFVARLPA